MSIIMKASEPSRCEQAERSELLDPAVTERVLERLQTGPREDPRLARLTQQEGKVLGLARRLRPGLTHEDVRNPHDFPELADPDWHYEDGILTGIQSVRMALRAQERREGREGPEGVGES